ncbi:MAG: inositol-3-phosphate synthase [Solirubrobacterales bacterium]|nr:inositol-3-phosphate synthase [Solirubrobacterales bacterium]
MSDNGHTSLTDDGRIGVAVVGLGGAVATTAAAGMELLRLGLAGHEGLPLAGTDGLAPYDRLVFAGWDVSPDDLAQAAVGHGVLDHSQLAAVAPSLSRIRPWPAIADAEFCRNIDGVHRMQEAGHRARVEAVADDLSRFREDEELEQVIVINLASVERTIPSDEPVLASLEAFETGLDADDPVIGPALLYAYAALREGCPYGNFTPSVAADCPALAELAEEMGVPVAGKDGKTGQTMMKTVIAPGLRSRALKVDGWYSGNLLGNRDGLALDDPDSLASKLSTKAAALDSILGYHVEDHVVTITYYKPRGDAKEAWDTIDLVGFLGQTMQLKVNFLCRDSILAAPLVIEMARVLDLAARTGECGPQEQLGAFFKAPVTADGEIPEHALHRQQEALHAWLMAANATAVGA